jgi:flavin-dependent dehydrogenase
MRVIIAGGSLAGLAAAIRLKQRGFDPVVYEQGPGPREKLCGEFLGPDGIAALRALGLDTLIQSQPRFDRVWCYPGAFPLGLHWINPHTPFGLAMPRRLLDPLLWNRAERLGVNIHTGVRVTWQNGLWLNGKPLNGSSTVPLIDATGRHGNLVPPPPKDTRRAGLQVHVAVACEHFSMVQFDGGYGGLLPLGPDEANVCLLLPAPWLTRIFHKF